jgi:hypothetical protein
VIGPRHRDVLDQPPLVLVTDGVEQRVDIGQLLPAQP